MLTVTENIQAIREPINNPNHLFFFFNGRKEDNPICHDNFIFNHVSRSNDRSNKTKKLIENCYSQSE